MASIAEINLLFVRLRIGRTTKMLHSANAEGVPSQKTRTHLSAKLSTTRVKGSRVHALPAPAHKEPVHRRFATCKRDSIWTSQLLGCLFCAWPWILTFRLRNSSGRDSIRSEI